MDAEQRQKITGYFVLEAKEHLEVIEQSLQDLQSTVDDPEMIQEVYRGAHSIKGGAAMLDLESIRLTANRLEDYFKFLKNNPRPVDEGLTHLLSPIYQGLCRMIDQVEKTITLPEEFAAPVMAEIEPLFAQVTQYLESSPQTSPRGSSPLPRAVYEEDILPYLEAIASLRSATDDTAHRHQIQSFCHNLRKLGETHSCPPWVNLVETSQQAILTPQSAYSETLDCMVRDLHQAAQYWVKGQVDHIYPSSQLQTLTTPPMSSPAEENPDLEALDLDSLADLDDFFSDTSPTPTLTDHPQMSPEEPEDLGFLDEGEFADLFGDAGSDDLESLVLDEDLSPEGIDDLEALLHDSSPSQDFPSFQVTPDDSSSSAHLTGLESIEALERSLEMDLESTLTGEDALDNLDDLFGEEVELTPSDQDNLDLADDLFGTDTDLLGDSEQFLEPDLTLAEGQELDSLTDLFGEGFAFGESTPSVPTTPEPEPPLSTPAPSPVTLGEDEDFSDLLDISSESTAPERSLTGEREAAEIEGLELLESEEEDIELDAFSTLIQSTDPGFDFSDANIPSAQAVDEEFNAILSGEDTMIQDMDELEAFFSGKNAQIGMTPNYPPTPEPANPVSEPEQNEELFAELDDVEHDLEDLFGDAQDLGLSGMPESGNHGRIRELGRMGGDESLDLDDLFASAELGAEAGLEDVSGEVKGVDDLEALLSGMPEESPVEGVDDLEALLSGMPEESPVEGVDDLEALLSGMPEESPVEGVDDLEALLSGMPEESPVEGVDDLEALLSGMPEESVIVPQPQQQSKAPEATPSTASNGEISYYEPLEELADLLEQPPSALAKRLGTKKDLPLATTLAELETLLEQSPHPLEAAPPPPTTRPTSESRPETDDFSDLEELLIQTQQQAGPPGDVKRRTPATRRAKSSKVEATLKVPVRQMDNLNNLIGELVVNRNSLEGDEERLRQFLENLMHQVQNLSDVGGRMQDLYERSLLEDALLRSRREYRAQHKHEVVIPGAAPITVEHENDYDSLEMDSFTKFHELAQEMIELIVRVRESASDIQFLVDDIDQVARTLRQVTSQLQEGLTKSRMVSFGNTANRLPLAVRRIAPQLGKEATLQLEGQETLIDKMILEHLSDPLTHLVNNALTHGIESPEERRRAGKPPSGLVKVSALQQGNQTVIAVSDDGAGINSDRVKAKAIQKGLITPGQAQQLSELDVYDLLFHPGFSTKDQADNFAGRGVGLDVVRTSINEIRGSVSIDSKPGRGTTFTIRLPLTLSICKALCCISENASIAFPLDGVEDMLDLPQNNIQRNAKGQLSIKWRDTTLQYMHLSELLSFNRRLGRANLYAGRRDDNMISVVILRSTSNYVAVGVDQVLGEQEIVIKQLLGPIPKPAGIAGATVQGDGRIMAIADVLELIEIAEGRIRKDMSAGMWQTPPAIRAQEESQIQREPVVLIVDDSITVRELLSLTFAKAGYRVEQARDGQDAWEKLRSGLPCDIVFCDIEMPRVDGLELLSRLQKDEVLAELPIAMLTSRGAERHRKMAAELGACGYFTKPYLEEVLLDAAQRMMTGDVLLAGSSRKPRIKETPTLVQMPMETAGVARGTTLPATPNPHDSHPPTVLIVDDSVTVRSLLSITFEKAGYEVEQARDGKEAWDKLQGGIRPDLALLDIEMPRMDGLELLGKIQGDSELGAIPVAMLTSRGAERHRKVAAERGASGYFTKPYVEQELLQAAERIRAGEVLLPNSIRTPGRTTGGSTAPPEAPVTPPPPPETEEPSFSLEELFPPEEVPRPPSPGPVKVQHSGQPRVLIIDDSVTVRSLLSMTFEKAGYEVEQARDGQDALKKLKAGLNPDITFCDIEMPKMDGLKLLSELKNDPELSKVPVAMLTSRGARKHRQIAAERGARGYFTKPYVDDILLDAAQRMINGEILLELEP
ncbi:hybrid sensor histidine kinase/response regulator [Spirulina subsalsa]|uniref:hybrid sensor histidine kinase/response regulator n=1 Tax=Spirulina subsalsa TaxID=54311 RepID=UPI0002E94455|nr:hybrid sensor histidine kinase/response regulator [Spirulina subsalsa]